ncbi:hypothetical protein BBR47_38960 [Brevibacillus brevis NBRC 100599]|uniref:Uncharacterized protein n=1 Tax=Brevibacillus brevis (strain 47 / JCM 6285 / NBRC 100599) TaxID=358681 RepID=C0ZGG4_BREBN|nr:hypothetical protein BBR47_38960 [Brevibacillus brevis NBRC 100599]
MAEISFDTTSLAWQHRTPFLIFPHFILSQNACIKNKKAALS